jgi:hypothetical protein
MMRDQPIDVSGEATLLFNLNGLFSGLVEDSPAGDEVLEFDGEPLPIDESTAFPEVHLGGRCQEAGQYYIGFDPEREIRIEAQDSPSRIVIDIATE